MELNLNNSTEVITLQTALIMRIEQLKDKPTPDEDQIKICKNLLEQLTGNTNQVKGNFTIEEEYEGNTHAIKIHTKRICKNILEQALLTAFETPNTSLINNILEQLEENNTLIPFNKILIDIEKETINQGKTLPQNAGRIVNSAKKLGYITKYQTTTETDHFYKDDNIIDNTTEIMNAFNSIKQSKEEWKPEPSPYVKNYTRILEETLQDENNQPQTNRIEEILNDIREKKNFSKFIKWLNIFEKETLKEGKNLKDNAGWLINVAKKHGYKAKLTTTRKMPSIIINNDNYIATKPYNKNTNDDDFAPF